MRGGLLGQASILTLTANGVDTSPVIRGIWVLESLLGTPPSEPPPDIEPINPDVRGAKTMKELLEKHRSVKHVPIVIQKLIHMVSHLNTLIQSVVIAPHTIDPVFGGIQRNPPSSSPVNPSMEQQP
jgi:hypothetical protein